MPLKIKRYVLQLFGVLPSRWSTGWCAAFCSFAHSVTKIAFLFRATACLQRPDKSVFVYTLQISSVGWEFNITHTNICKLILAH